MVVTFPDRQLTLDSDWKKAPGSLHLTVPTGPIALRVNLYYGDRPVASYEYTIRPGPVIVNPFGPRYLKVSIEEKTTGVHGDIHAYGPFVFSNSIGYPATEVEWCYWYYPDDGSGPVTYRLSLYICFYPSVSPTTLLQIALGAPIIAGELLMISNSCLTRLLNDIFHLPPSLIRDPLIVPPRLPPQYILLGLAACMTTVAVRHEVSLLLQILSNRPGLSIPIGDMAALPLGIWGLRLIAAATGLPTPLAGIAARFVQWVL
ncbi:hypothetical protein, partial [Methanopyrus sp.]